MAGKNKRAILMMGSLLLLVVVLPARAQVQVGENTSMNLNGTVAVGYNGSFSNFAASSHGINGAGDADLTGSYYSPNFLSFDIHPFYNQSRANSTSQSIFESSGVGATASLFGGSNFPGNISYSRTYNSEGGFVLPELGSITTHGNNQNLAISWGVHIPNYPTISFQFMDGSNANSVFGTNAESTAHSDAFGVNVSHTLAGFNLNGGYQHNTLHAVTPGFLTGDAPENSDSSSNSFNFGVGHSLPLRGSASVGFSRSEMTGEFGTGSNSMTVDTISSGAGFQPLRNLNVGVNAQYTDNLAGTLYQSIIIQGGVVPQTSLQYSSKALDINTHANYNLPGLHLAFGVGADHREQTALGTSIASNTFSEMATYGNSLLGGFVNATMSVNQTSVDVANNPNSMGWTGIVSYLRAIRRWKLSGAVNYSRNSQTALVTQTSSGHGYSVGLGRRIGTHSNWSFNAAASKSTFDNVSGSESLNQSYSTGLSLNRVSFGSAYAKASGTSILTPTGLVPVTVIVPVFTPSQVILFGGTSYSFSASTHPIRPLTISASYSKSMTNTSGISASSQNSTNQLNMQLQYKFRQLWMTAGYLKLEQGFSITGAPPTSASSFFVGVSRWFKFF